MLPPSPSHAASKPILSHQPRHSLAVTAHSQGSEFSVNSGVAIGLSAPVVDLPDPLSESSILPGSLRGRPLFPSVVAAPRDIQDPAQHRDGISGLLMRSNLSHGVFLST